MYCNGPRCFLISIKSISLDDLPNVLESIYDRFTVVSVSIRFHHDPVVFTTSSFYQPDHLPSFRGGGSV